MSETADLALIGRRVAGKFVVERFLGGGSMGAVYRARDESLQRNVALKVMHPAVAADPTLVGRFHREARAASRLDHPNSMRVIEFGEEPDGLLFIAMEYLEGRDLYKVIHEDWPLPEVRIADIVMKALAAIAVAHDMGVIHRDLKPENIMILDRKDDEGQDIVKVCDFGIAKITETDDASPNAPPMTAGIKVTTAGLVVGTPEYMSPEQARGEKLDSRSDLYSMGIILYQLLTGRTPFMAESPLAVVLKHITEPPSPPSTIYPEVHKGLQAVCMRALMKLREERFQSARDMRAALKAAIEGRPLPEHAEPASAEPAPGGNEPNAGAVTSSPAAVVARGEPSNVAPRATSGIATKEETRSRAPLLVAVGLTALVIGGVGMVLLQREDPTADPSVPASSESATAIKINVKASAAASHSGSPQATPRAEPKAPKRPTPVPKATATATATVSATAEPKAAPPESSADP